MTKNAYFVLSITCICLSLPGNVCLAQHAAGRQTTAEAQQLNLPELKNIGMMIGKGEPQAKYLAVWKQLVSKSKNMDIHGAINLVIDEAKQETNRNVNQRRSKTQKYDAIKGNISQEISVNRSILSRAVGKIQPIQEKIYVIERGNPDKFTVQKGNVINTRSELENYVKNLEGILNRMGDDSQLANLALQDALQKQQAFVQTVTEVSRTFDDAAKAIIGNMKP
jgi:hypothetical protein